MGSQELGMDSQGHKGIGSHRAARLVKVSGSCGCLVSFYQGEVVLLAFLDALPCRCMWVVLVLEVVLLCNLGWIQI